MKKKMEILERGIWRGVEGVADMGRLGGRRWILGEEKREGCGEGGEVEGAWGCGADG